MRLSGRAAWFLLAVGVWTWAIWPNFLRNIWNDDRSWDGGPTSFFVVHAVLTVTSLALGTAVGWLGVRGIRAGAAPGSPTSTHRRTTWRSRPRGQRTGRCRRARDSAGRGAA